MKHLTLKVALLTLLLIFLTACGTTRQPAPTDGKVDLASTQLAGSGSVRAWSGGVKAWSGGVKAWSGGGGSVDSSGAVLVENTPIWEKLQLIVAHQVLAKNLGKDVIVAVIDTGVDYRHPIFVNRLAARNTWYDFVSRDTNPQEVSGAAYGHGTVVASIVLQVAPNAKIMPLRALAGNGSGNVAHVAAAIDWAANRGAKIIQLSLGTESASPEIEAAVDRAARRGIYVIASAGNSNSNPTYPAYTARW
jgi:thermitase